MTATKRQRLTQRERRAICQALALLGSGEWNADFEEGKPDPFDHDDIESARDKIATGLKERGQ